MEEAAQADQEDLNNQFHPPTVVLPVVFAPVLQPQRSYCNKHKMCQSQVHYLTTPGNNKVLIPGQQRRLEFNLQAIHQILLISKLKVMYHQRKLPPHQQQPN